MVSAGTVHILNNPIEYLKGIGPQRADWLKKELSLFTYGDLLHYFPLRHIDKTIVIPIGQINNSHDQVQVAGSLINIEVIGEGRGKRLVALLKDNTGLLELVWFQGIQWVQKSLALGKPLLVYGKLSWFNGKAQITHPELEAFVPGQVGGKAHFDPVYPTTEKLKARGISGRAIGKFTAQLFQLLREQDIPEILPDTLLHQLQLPERFQAYKAIHFPASQQDYQRAVYRIKWEELFLHQLRLGLIRAKRQRLSVGVRFAKVGPIFNNFYQNHLPFSLTNAQKRVLKEIRADVGSGHQMNRLVQGDVGSGKTMVALLSMLLAIDNGYQACLMAPTEILATQHFQSISALLEHSGLQVALLTGSTKTAQRKQLLAAAANGELHLLIGTHALIEDTVQFKQLGLAIVDEQHRFGVAQRAKLWQKATVPPHVLVMTATPIPRTLAMTQYGDLDVSIIDELPPGRQPITTVQRPEGARGLVFDFIRQEVEKGRQVYIIYPLIEESEALSYEDLMNGYERVKAHFPEPKYWISMVHGRMPADQKETNMKRFAANDTQIMVSTTVIEVGVNVPNATIMVIESAEKFGLSQLHQLRGRVGRGAEKSFCILLTGNNLNQDARERLNIMCATNDGFLIAEKDMELRGPGDVEGTRQSGEMPFQLANIALDREILLKAREWADALLQSDPDLSLAQHVQLKNYMSAKSKRSVWSKIS